MKLKLVNYEVATLAKEVGFNVACSDFFIEIDEEIMDETGPDVTSNEVITVRPMQELLRTWLREKQNLHIAYGISYGGKSLIHQFVVHLLREETTVVSHLLRSFKYEEGLEQALKHGLNLVKGIHKQSEKTHSRDTH